MLRPGGYGTLGKSRMPPAPQPMRVIELPSATSKLHRVENAWTPRFKGSSAASSDLETIETEVLFQTFVSTFIDQYINHSTMHIQIMYKYKYCMESLISINTSMYFSLLILMHY